MERHEPLPDHQVVAIADCRRDRALLAQKSINDFYAGRVGQQQFKGCDIYNDFRELLARKDIDAVWGCVPDHWHGVVYSRAIEAGKDIYGEKPLTRWIADGIKVRDAVRRYGCVFQTGTMQRSWPQFRQACELAINGYLGKVHTIHVAAPRRTILSGRAAVRSARRVRLRYVDRPGALYSVRQEALRMAGHVHDLALLCRVHHQLGRSLSGHRRLGMPRGSREAVRDRGNRRVADRGHDRHVDFLAVEFALGERPEDELHQRRRLAATSTTRQERNAAAACSWATKAGSTSVGSGIWAEPASLLTVKLKPSDTPLHHSPECSNDPNRYTAHTADFFRSVRTRQDPVSPVESGHAASTLGNVSDIALRLGRKLKWDPTRDRFVGDDEANQMLSRPARSPWTI